MSPQSSPKSMTKNVLPRLRSDAAGIDVGATELYVAVPPDRMDKPVRCFGTFTEDLEALAGWLTSHSIRTVAMESTGVYWIPLFQILEDRGFEVYLVNARHVKNVPGRKTDVSDCQWLQYLHSVGLLHGSFRPPQQMCAVRTILRHRDALTKQVNVHVQHMQKSLTQMNLQIHHVISNIVGTTGLAIIDALLAGERNTETLAAFRDPRIRSSQETIAKSLVGDYRDEHFFTLRQALESFRHCQKQIAECDQTVKTMLAKFDSRVDVEKNPLTNDSKPVKKRNDPLLIRNDFYRISGVDLTAIPGIQAASVSTILSEIGTNVSRFPTAKHFASWLGLCPTNKISGGRILSSRTQPVNNRASTALRIAATTLLRSPSALGQYLRRMRAKLGMPKAVTATAHKLARIIYHLLKTQQSYDQSCFARFEEENNRRQQIRLKNQAKSMGFALVPL